MYRATLVGMTLAVFTCGLGSTVARAQQATSGIAGVVRDTSGGVLPGITVEAASPVLIEKVRSVVSDNEGRYNVVDLRPGVYTVTFSLAGFRTFRREGIVLTAGFTATVNADMQVGGIEETVTVTGAAPLIDTQNVRQQKVVSQELLQALPSSTMSLATLTALTPGLVGQVTVGGAAGTYQSASQSATAFHGKANTNKVLFDGMRMNNFCGVGSPGFIANPAAVEETSVETGGVSAESTASAVVINMVPKEGGNTFRFFASGGYSNSHLQSDNLTDALRARGLTTVNQVEYIYDSNAALGGPIKQNRLWFFTANRLVGSKSLIGGVFWNSTQGTPFYTPDLSRPSNKNEKLEAHSVRLTWQASPKNRVNTFAEIQKNCVCLHTYNFAAPEAVWGMHFFPQGLFQTSWSSPLTSKILLDGGFSAVISHWPTRRTPGTSQDAISIREQSTGFTYNSWPGYGERRYSDRYNQRFSVSYVTGSHAFKVGFQDDQGIYDNETEVNADISYRFLNGVPNQVTQYATPYINRARMKADLGLFAQDQWTTGRLTLSYGLRFDYFNAYVPAQHVDATRFVPARDYAPLYGVPVWKDLSPRVGVAYDLFGTGKTALKIYIGKYMVGSNAEIAKASDPIQTSVNSVNRTWSDANRNYIPDCDLQNPAANGECGPFQNTNFGQLNIRTTYADDVIRGFGARDFNWDIATEVQHELIPGMSLTAGYYHNQFGNLRVTNNLEVTPADYSPFCITAPVDPRLPGGGGYQVCGMYDVAPAKLGKINEVVTQASNFGTQIQASNFVTVSANTRFASGLRIGGGLDTGRTVNDRCFVVDSPQELLNCRVVTPFKGQTEVKLHWSYPLPADTVLSGVLQNASGPEIQANYPATNTAIAPSLGRSLAACGGRAACTATATVPLIVPMTQFEGRRTQLDLRLSKIIRLGSGLRLQANFDIYNALNGQPIMGLINTYGPRWLQPAATSRSGAVLDARLLQFSGQLNF